MKNVIVIVVIILAIVSSYYISSPKQGAQTPPEQVGTHPSPQLTADKVISDQTIKDSIIQKLISPKGNRLTKITTDADDPNIMDEAWRYEYYTCSENEHFGWIYNYPGGDMEQPTLYGPYEWCYQ